MYHRLYSTSTVTTSSSPQQCMTYFYAKSLGSNNADVRDFTISYG
jgi:hypothetical protein